MVFVEKKNWMSHQVFMGYASNTLINQHGDINHTHEVLQDDSKCEMIVGIDHFMTASAKYCDILLPD
ncbi:Dimethyl sulfoxide reductase chain A [Escherichia coli]|uniref:Dimethyl sulfoxide reductase chain A n=1 Tax=Escherichia coli TaxID=562 RepID=A0A376RIL9_ECOLX|nr:Dimethyl sulfoxide reductase chain A [Escherichia coli]